MLTTILRFSPVLNVSVGPRFDALQPYNRPGLSLVVRTVPKLQLPKFSHMADVRTLVHARVQAPKGVIKATAAIQQTPIQYAVRESRRAVTMASAVLVGTPLKQNFGSVE